MIRTKRARRAVLLGASAYAAGRVWLYWPGQTVSEPILFGTDGGTFMPVYVTLWAAAAVLCLWDMRAGRFGVGLHLTIGLLWAWAFLWTIGGIITEYDLAWETSLTQIGLAAMVHGLSRVVTTLERILEGMTERRTREC